jgi:pimeloyl-ACP methyl ester carboxylesterase
LVERRSTGDIDVADVAAIGSAVDRLDLPGLANALISYCDAVGVDKATVVGNSLGCPIVCEVAASFPERIERAVLVSRGRVVRPTNRWGAPSVRWCSTFHVNHSA